jgi:hypothetical protein
MVPTAGRSACTGRLGTPARGSAYNPVRVASAHEHGEHLTLWHDKRVHLTLTASGVGIRLVREASSMLNLISTQTEPLGWPG